MGKTKARLPHAKKYSPLHVRVSLWGYSPHLITAGDVTVHTIKIGVRDQIQCKTMYLNHPQNLCDCMYAPPLLLDGLLANYMFLGLDKERIKKYVKKGILSA